MEPIRIRATHGLDSTTLRVCPLSRENSEKVGNTPQVNQIVVAWDPLGGHKALHRIQWQAAARMLVGQFEKSFSFQIVEDVSEEILFEGIT